MNDETTSESTPSPQARHKVAPRRKLAVGVREQSAARRALARLDPPDTNATTPSHRQPRTTGPDATERNWPTYEAGELVRWKRRSRNWRYGRLADPPHERDGSLRVVEDGTGAARSLRPSQLERQTRGPRGALKWAPCTPTKPPQGGTDGIRTPPLRPGRTTQGLGR